MRWRLLLIKVKNSLNALRASKETIFCHVTSHVILTLYRFELSPHPLEWGFCFYKCRFLTIDRLPQHLSLNDSCTAVIIEGYVSCQF